MKNFDLVNNALETTANIEHILDCQSLVLDYLYGMTGGRDTKKQTLRLVNNIDTLILCAQNFTSELLKNLEKISI